MFVVYWMEYAAAEADSGAGAEASADVNADMNAKPRAASRLFDQDRMAEALVFMEELRTAQRTGERRIAFITMASENPAAVGKAGAADPAATYAWTKRRGNRPRAKRDLLPGDFDDF